MPAKKSSHAITFISGNDEADVKTEAVKTAAQLAPGADEFGLEKIDGSVDSVDAAVQAIHRTRDALLTLPFLGGKKLVWLKSATFLADTVTGRSESVLTALESLCETLQQGLPDGVSFLMSAIEPDKRRSAYKTLCKVGHAVTCDKPTLGFGAGEEEMISWTAGKLRSRGLKISEEAVEVLTARVGMDSRQLESELLKLETAFGHAHRIEASDIRSLVPATRESGIFDLSNAIGARDLPLALDTLAQLQRQGENGVGILLVAFVPTIRNLLLVKSLLARHRLPAPSDPRYFASTLNKLPAEATSHLPVKKDGTLNTYSLGIAAKNSTRFTLPALRRAFRECAEANLALISSQGAESTILSRILISLLSEPA